jgi:excisionase family DNA binding protein
MAMCSVEQNPQPLVVPLLTVRDVAGALACSQSNVYDLIGTGKLRAIRAGKSGGCFRVRREDLEHFIEANATDLR